MHNLVNTWGYEPMDSEEQLKYGQEALEFIDNLLTHQLFSLAIKTRLVPHIMACFSRLQDFVMVGKKLHEKSLDLLNTCSRFLRDGGQFAQGVEICQLRCEVSRHLPDDNEELVSDADQDLAHIYWYQGRYAEAEELELKVIEIQMKEPGEEHPDTLATMASLALTYSHQKRHEDALELELKILKTKRRVLGKEHPDTLKNEQFGNDIQ